MERLAAAWSAAQAWFNQPQAVGHDHEPPVVDLPDCSCRAAGSNFTQEPTMLQKLTRVLLGF